MRSVLNQNLKKCNKILRHHLTKSLNSVCYCIMLLVGCHYPVSHWQLSGDLFMASKSVIQQSTSEGTVATRTPHLLCKLNIHTVMWFSNRENIGVKNIKVFISWVELKCNIINIIYFNWKHSAGEGLSWKVHLFKSDIKEVEFQIVCLSWRSVLIERVSWGSDAGKRLLSTPSRLFRHTGQVSCCDKGRKIYR